MNKEDEMYAEIRRLCALLTYYDPTWRILVNTEELSIISISHGSREIQDESLTTALRTALHYYGELQ